MTVIVPERDGRRFPVHSMRRIRTSDGRFLYRNVSDGVAAAFGLDKDLLTAEGGVDHRWIDLRDRTKFVEALHESAGSGKPLDIEVRVIMPDGSLKWIRSMGDPVSRSDGSTIWDGVALEVTDRREALERVEQAMEAARAAEAAASTPAWVADHRMREAVHIVSDLVGTTGPIKSADAVRAALARLMAILDKSSPPARTTLDSLLTARQREIASHIVTGRSNREIAEILDLREGTIKVHVTQILKRTGARNRTALAVGDWDSSYSRS